MDRKTIKFDFVYDERGLMMSNMERTSKEVAYLLKHYATSTTEAIAKQIGRNKNFVYNLAYEYELTKDKMNKNSKSRLINMYDAETNEYIDTYNNISEAAKDNYMSTTAINYALKNNKGLVKNRMIIFKATEINNSCDKDPFDKFIIEGDRYERRKSYLPETYIIT